MTWTVAVRAAAERDVQAALAWYETEAPEQVARFAVEFVATIDRIAAYAEVIAPFSGVIRRMRLRIFPYQVWYMTDPTIRRATVLAVVHDRQDRESFTGRY